MMTKEELRRYEKLIDDYIKPNIFASCSPACGDLKYPFVDPSAQYAGNLWDWDSFWVLRVMFMALERYKNHPDFDYKATREKTLLHAKGTIFNFFDHQEEDGFIPMLIASSGPFHNFYRDAHRAGEKHNAHKPFLMQNILQICEYVGDYGWFDLDKAVKYLEYYENAQQDKDSGLFFWMNDFMIGIDNNPTAFFRKNESSADIFLNSFLSAEYDALVTLLERNGDARAELFRAKGRALKEAINRLCYDKKDEIYYSQDLSFCRGELPTANGFVLHENMQPWWHTMPMKVRFWGCFAPLYAGICSKEQAEAIDRRHLKDPAVMAKYGVRTVAEDEVYYNLEKTSNPSNWLGAIWIVANYCVYRGLKNYGIETYKELAERTVRLLGENLEKSGEMYESYLPDTGEPCLYPHFFNWNLLVMEMLPDLV